MKKYAFMILASMAIASCVQEEMGTENGADASAYASFKASREDFGGNQPSTRTVLADGYSVNWVKDDAVAVFDGAASGHVFTAVSGGAKSDFVTSDESFNKSADKYLFVYPSAESVSADVAGSKINFTLAAEQQAVTGSFDPAYAFAVTKSTGLSETIVFKNPLSLLKFTVPEGLAGKVKKISVQGRGESDVLGGELICDCSGDAPVASLSANGVAEMSLVSENGMAAGDYYLAVLPGTVTGLTLTVTTKDGNSYPRLTNADTGKTFKAGYVHDMGAVSISEGTLLDVAFRADGSAYDRSAYGRTVKYVPKDGLTVYKNYNFGGYVANFKPETMGSNYSTGYYDFDYSSNSTVKDDIADGHSLEVLFRLDESVDGYAKEVKMLSSMGGGGTGIMITKASETNATKNAIILLAHVGGAYKYTDSKIVPEVGTFYHVVGVYDKANAQTHIYVNGALKGSLAASGAYKHPNESILQWFCVGGDAGKSSGAHCGENMFDGDIAIARVYSEPVTADKVTALYNEAKHIIAPVPNPNVKIIAHQGYHHDDVPANSLDALKEAQKLGVYGSEFDVWMTSDGQLIVWHDKNITVGGETELVYDCTYAEVQAVAASNGKPLATFEEFLEQGKKCPEVKLVCEIKYHADADATIAVATKCHELVTKAGMNSQIEYISYDSATLKALAKLSPGVMTQYLNTAYYYQDPATPFSEGVKGVNYQYNHANFTDAVIAKAHEVGMVVGTWTVNDETSMRNMIDRGVDFITTDDPVLLQQVLAEYQPE